MINKLNQMINNINKVIAMFIAVVFLTPAVTFAEPSVSDAGSSAAAVTVSVPSVSNPGNSSVSVSVSVPSTTNQGNSGSSGSVSTPSTTDHGNSAVSSGSNTPSTTNQGNSGSSGSVSTPSTTDQGNSAVSSNPNSGSSSNGGGSSSTSGSSSRSGGRSGSVRYIAGFPVNNSGCPYITSYMKMDNANDPTQVIRLQTFLKINERLNLDINGKFDQKTHDAVKAFQTKYANDVLLPWGGAKATGHVFYTTQKKINELVCKTPVTLTSAQLKAIEAFKSGQNEEAVKIQTANGDIIIDNDSNSSTSPVVAPEVGKNTTDTQSASAVKVSVGSKVWSFVKWLFGYNK